MYRRQKHNNASVVRLKIIQEMAKQLLRELAGSRRRPPAKQIRIHLAQIRCHKGIDIRRVRVAHSERKAP
jgi:hypothetical protein